PVYKYAHSSQNKLHNSQNSDPLLFINSIYLYFYFQYLSTFNIRKLLLILKNSKDQILYDFYSSSILKGYVYFYLSHFPVRYLYFYSSMAFGYFIHHCFCITSCYLCSFCISPCFLCSFCISPCYLCSFCISPCYLCSFCISPCYL